MHDKKKKAFLLGYPAFARPSILCSRWGVPASCACKNIYIAWRLQQVYCSALQHMVLGNGKKGRRRCNPALPSNIFMLGNFKETRWSGIKKQTCLAIQHFHAWQFSIFMFGLQRIPLVGNEQKAILLGDPAFSCLAIQHFHARASYIIPLGGEWKIGDIASLAKWSWNRQQKS